jgi:hypothetical protein
VPAAESLKEEIALAERYTREEHEAVRTTNGTH